MVEAQPYYSTHTAVWINKRTSAIKVATTKIDGVSTTKMWQNWHKDEKKLIWWAKKIIMVKKKIIKKSKNYYGEQRWMGHRGGHLYSKSTKNALQVYVRQYGKSNIKQQVLSLSHCWVMLVWRHHTVSQSVENSVIYI